MNTIWKFLEPTRPKVWIAIILWTFYWLVGKIDTSISFPLVAIFYPDYIRQMLEKMLPESQNLMATFSTNVIEVTNLFLAVHIAVAAVLGYVGGCLIIYLFNTGKVI